MSLLAVGERHLARAAGHRADALDQGIRRHEAIIDAGGKVVSPRILKSIPLLDKAALDAVKQRQFNPATRDGRPVPVNVTLSVEFALPEHTGPTACQRPGL